MELVEIVIRVVLVDLVNLVVPGSPVDLVNLVGLVNLVDLETLVGLVNQVVPQTQVLVNLMFQETTAWVNLGIDAPIADHY